MKKLFAFLASLKLAVILLVVLLVGLSVGTIVETRTDAETAGRLVYYAPWFLAIQGLFALNVALSLVDLFPWGRKRIGFMVVHASLLLILVGASLTFFFKTEGSMGMWEGDSASAIVRQAPDGQVISSHELPFTVKLEDFVLDTYPGTMRPAGFMSNVQITDRDSGRTFPARIWMNHELHYRGYALFQSSYQQSQGREATVLSVSKDPGQTIAFVGFITLVVGMVLVMLTRISQVRGRATQEGNGRKALLALLLLGGAVLQAQADPEVLRRLPVQHDGRVMPLDTLARETVWTVTGSNRWQGQDPVVTLTTWTLDPRSAVAAPVVQVGSGALAQSLGLPAGTTHRSFMQLIQNPGLSRLLHAAEQAEAQGMPRQGVMQDAEKLHQRILALKAVLFHETIRPIPLAGDPRAQWGVPSPLTAETLAQLMSGPRMAEWPSQKKIDSEIFYNRLNPARLSWIILLASLVLTIAAWIRKSRLLDGLAFGALIAGFGMMTWGILLRWQAGERIPAANMYESLLFLAWGVGLFAIAAYLILKNRIVVLNAAVMATLTMVLTDLLPIDRFIHPIAPVLAGTPWLAIHVPIIMLGYSILALGVVVAHMQVGVTIFAPQRRELIDRMYDLNYWYTFAGSIFLLAGILTGSMWAASSWGRYWGWDPKEVWSLVAFLAYMAILHAKLDRLIGKFGVAAISIIAFQTILMTYLGVNFVLSTGMHSYGMGDSPVVMWMVLVAVAETVFLIWGVLVHRKHRLAGIEEA